MHMRSLLRALLNSIGITEITEATNGQAAIALLHAHSPDLVLTDLAMAPMDGLEFTRHIRNHEDSPNPFVPSSWSAVTPRSTGWKGRAMPASRNSCQAGQRAQSVFTHCRNRGRPRAFVRCDTYFGPIAVAASSMTARGAAPKISRKWILPDVKDHQTCGP